MTGCTSEDPSPYPSTQAIETSDKLSEQQAISIALSAAHNFFGSSSRTNHHVTASHAHIISSNPASRTATDTVLYIVNFDDDNGFAIVNANKKGDQLYAVTDKGQYNTLNLDANPPGLNMYVDYAIQKSKLDANGTTITPVFEPYQILKTDTLYSGLPPKIIDAQWDQTGFYGQFCPNGIAGCVPVALGQALTRHKEPQEIALTFPNASYDKIICDWDIIGKVKGFPNFSTSIFSSDGIDNHTKIGLLLREIGYRLNVTYYAESTGLPAYQIYTVRELADELLQGSSVSVSPFYETGNQFAITQEDLSNGNGIIFMGGIGTYPTTQLSAGHAWVVDSFKHLFLTDNIYEVGDNGRLTLIKRGETREIYYVHINWGWGGRNNGYFLPTVLNPKDFQELDTNVNTSNMDINFNYGFKYFIIRK